MNFCKIEIKLKKSDGTKWKSSEIKIWFTIWILQVILSMSNGRNRLCISFTNAQNKNYKGEE